MTVLIACGASGAWLGAVAQSAPPAGDGASAASPAASAPRKSATRRVGARDWHAREAERYRRDWGIDVVGIRPTGSGYMLRFTYRVLDPAKAQPLSDKRAKAYVVDEESGVTLSVPAMENVGELRQTPPPAANRSYYVMFGNPGKLVKTGSRVSVVIGRFRVDGLPVE
jgi:pyruvate/2-oxoglutarate dehydrogenase complex dihydrolipoamide acyltransferase (E2) component